MSRYRLSQKADSDIENIVEYTLENWGVSQVKKYIGGLITCFEGIASNDHMGPRCIRNCR